MIEQLQQQLSQALQQAQTMLAEGASPYLMVDVSPTSAVSSESSSSTVVVPPIAVANSAEADCEKEEELTRKLEEQALELDRLRLMLEDMTAKQETLAEENHKLQEDLNQLQKIRAELAAAIDLKDKDIQQLSAQTKEKESELLTLLKQSETALHTMAKERKRLEDEVQNYEHEIIQLKYNKSPTKQSGSSNSNDNAIGSADSIASSSSITSEARQRVGGLSSSGVADIEANLTTSDSESEKKEYDGTNSFLVHVWRIIGQHCPGLLSKIGDRPPRIPPFTRAIIMGYFLFLQLLSIYLYARGCSPSNPTI